jgi:predicted phage-related endonuclease
MQKFAKKFAGLEQFHYICLKLTNMKLTDITPINVTIGGSQISSVLGVSSYCTPHQMWLQIMGQLKYENEAMRRGKVAEAFIQAWAAESLGFNYLYIQLPILIGAARGTIDAITNDGSLIDFKSSSLLKETVPNEYKLQLIWYAGLAKMAGYQINKLLIIAADGFFNLSVHEVQFDSELFSIMNEKAGLWYERHIIGGEEPPMTALEKADYFGKLKPSGVKIADDKVKEWVEDLRNIKAQISELEKKAEVLTAEIKSYMAESELLIAGDKPIASWKVQTRTTIDTSALKKAMPDVAKKFEKMSEIRIFKLN